MSAKQDSNESPEPRRMLLAFGVGFSYQLGHGDADSPTIGKKVEEGSGSDEYCRAAGSPSEGRRERGSSTARRGAIQTVTIPTVVEVMGCVKILSRSYNYSYFTTGTFLCL